MATHANDPKNDPKKDPMYYHKLIQIMEQQKLEQQMRDAQLMRGIPPIWQTGYGNGSILGQPNYGGGAGGYLSGATSTAVQSRETELALENANLRRQVEDLTRALNNPDLPLATSIKDLIKKLNPEDVAGRTAPPFTETSLSKSLSPDGKAISGGTFGLNMRGGHSTRVRLVGLIVRDEGPEGSIPAHATYMVPTKAMKEGDALEAVADLVSHIVVNRVLKEMGEET